MANYQTTRLLVCCAFDRIWSSTQRLEDLDWFRPEGALRPVRGWCSCSIALEPRYSKFRGELASFQAVCSLRVEPSPMWGASPFIVQGGPPVYIYLSRCPSSARGTFIFVSRRAPLGRSGVKRLVLDWFSWATGCQAVVPSLVSRGGFATRLVARRSSPFLSVRTSSSVRSATARPSLHGFCLKDGSPVEGCLASVRRRCPIIVTGGVLRKPSLRYIGWSSLTLSPISHPLHCAGCTTRTVSLSGSPVDCAGVACVGSG